MTLSVKSSLTLGENKTGFCRESHILRCLIQKVIRLQTLVFEQTTFARNCSQLAFHWFTKSRDGSSKGVERGGGGGGGRGGKPHPDLNLKTPTLFIDLGRSISMATSRKYCKRGYFHAAKFSRRIKPFETYSRS